MTSTAFQAVFLCLSGASTSTAIGEMRCGAGTGTIRCRDSAQSLTGSVLSRSCNRSVPCMTGTRFVVLPHVQSGAAFEPGLVVGSCQRQALEVNIASTRRHDLQARRLASQPGCTPVRSSRPGDALPVCSPRLKFRSTQRHHLTAEEAAMTISLSTKLVPIPSIPKTTEAQLVSPPGLLALMALIHRRELGDIQS